MTRICVLVALCATFFSVKAQQTPPAYEPYGKVDKEDLELKACDFEKDANAETLIDKGDLYYDMNFNIVMDCHKRIKIFNDKGADRGNIKLEYISYENYESITKIQGETINLEDGKTVITKLDKKQIYVKPIDKYHSAVIFSMPNIKAGSIIEFKYTWSTTEADHMPRWTFQDKIPVRYSEFDTSVPEYFYFSEQLRAYMPFTVRKRSTESGSLGAGANALLFTKNIDQRVMTNLMSVPDEPYMTSFTDNQQAITFHLTNFKPPYGFVQSFSDTWAKVGGNLADYEDFGRQLKRKLANEDSIVAKVKNLGKEEKIARIFNLVKNTMKWNEEDEWFTEDGTKEAWEKKTGNSAEINLILCRLLRKAGVEALPMVVSTRQHGKVNPVYTFLYQFNRAVVYIPVDSTQNYILDATGKYNSYNETPYELLNSYGLYINPDEKRYDIVFINRSAPVRQMVFVTAEISPAGKINGTAQISCTSYDRVNDLTRYKTDGEKKFMDHLKDGDNTLKISSLKLDNMDVDSLPLVENINFDMDLSSSDENYIYLKPNLFSSMSKNPFISENRYTDIDFGCNDNMVISGVYKLPVGYKVDVLPKNVSMTMPDKSYTFKRIVGEQDGNLVIRCTINHTKSLYFKNDYPDFHEFYKKMYEMMNEQIVLKKS